MATPRATGQEQPPPLSDAEEIARFKRAAARAAGELVQDGMRVGLGTGSTVAYLLHALGERELQGVRYAATSPETERIARELGLAVVRLDELGELDVAIDGADQVDPQGWLIKGGGGAHTREKIVAADARCFVVIVSAEKLVPRLSAPVPLELVPFAVQTTLAKLHPTQLRDVPRSPDGGLIADYLGPIEDPRALADTLSATPGVVEHGLFQPELVSLVLIAGAAGVDRRAGGKPRGAAAS
ncbi:MAG TPA: ribose-5-phosphate isomerase RpiA [Solirubrobacteraceae bacterium]|nr:ribose-5-phosphate isomerase RpiA [Solirubrobacteraceae bacterium]